MSVDRHPVTGQWVPSVRTMVALHVLSQILLFVGLYVLARSL